MSSEAHFARLSAEQQLAHVVEAYGLNRPTQAYRAICDADAPDHGPLHGEIIFQPKEKKMSEPQDPYRNYPNSALNGASVAQKECLSVTGELTERAAGFENLVSILQSQVAQLEKLVCAIDGKGPLPPPPTLGTAEPPAPHSVVMRIGFAGAGVAGVSDALDALIDRLERAI